MSYGRTPRRGSLRGICGKADECGSGRGIPFEVASPAAIATDQGESPFDDPSAQEDLKDSGIRSLGDFQLPGPGTPDDRAIFFPAYPPIALREFSVEQLSSGHGLRLCWARQSPSVD